MLKTTALAAMTLMASHTMAWSDGYGAPGRQRELPVTTWHGFYVGLYAGGAWGDADLHTDAGSFTPTSYFTSAANIASINQNGSGSERASSAVTGAQIGGNLQTGALVFGLEADIGTFDLKVSRGAAGFAYPTFPATYSVRAALETDWLATIRGRVGWTPRSDVLIYATGGWALAGLDVSYSFSDTAVSAGLGAASNSEVKSGWALGGGAEWAIARRWSLKAEYLHVDLGSVRASGSVSCGPAGAAVCTFFGVTPNAFTTSGNLAADIARVGINYRF